MANTLLQKLRSNDKKGLFKPTQTSVSYQTGFLPLDYKNGYLVQVRDLNDNIVSEYPSIGIVGGTFVTIIGKSGTAKTTFACQLASNIVKKFDNGLVVHFDLEQALTYTRIKNITKLSHADLGEKYILKQEKNYIEDIFDTIMEIANAKEADRESFMYDTKLKDEFNNPIRAFVPTIVIIDSIPTLASKDSIHVTGRGDSKVETMQMEGGTYANRVAKSLAQFYKRLMPIIKTYNITVIAINHVNQKIEINPMMHTAPQLNYLGNDKSIPGGNAPIYYAHNLFEFIAKDKYKEEEHGFDGFDVRCLFLKSRSNKAGQFCTLVYNQVTGFDPILTHFKFANENGLIDGTRNPHKYIKGYEDFKFDTRKFNKVFEENEKVRMALFDTTIPILEQQLSKINSGDEFNLNNNNYLDIIKQILERTEVS